MLYAFLAGPTLASSVHEQGWRIEMAQQVTDADFASQVLAAETPVLVDFTADWCGPCKAIAPTIEALSAELAGRVKIVKLDVDGNPATASQYNVRSMPTFILFKGGEPVDLKIGAGQSRVQMLKWLESYAA
jgi:thioredoxin 1